MQVSVPRQHRTHPHGARPTFIHTRPRRLPFLVVPHGVTVSVAIPQLGYHYCHVLLNIKDPGKNADDWTSPTRHNVPLATHIDHFTMIPFSPILALLSYVVSAQAAPATATAAAALPTATSNVAGLHALAKQAGKLYFGTATDNPELTDTPYVNILNNVQMFGQITAANSMKWVRCTTFRSPLCPDHPMCTSGCDGALAGRFHLHTG